MFVKARMNPLFAQRMSGFMSYPIFFKIPIGGGASNGQDSAGGNPSELPSNSAVMEDQSLMENEAEQL